MLQKCHLHNWWTHNMEPDRPTSVAGSTHLVLWRDHISDPTTNVQLGGPTTASEFHFLGVYVLSFGILQNQNSRNKEMLYW